MGGFDLLPCEMLEAVLVFVVADTSTAHRWCVWQFLSLARINRAARDCIKNSSTWTDQLRLRVCGNRPFACLRQSYKNNLRVTGVDTVVASEALLKFSCVFNKVKWLLDGNWLTKACITGVADVMMGFDPEQIALISLPPIMDAPMIVCSELNERNTKVKKKWLKNWMRIVKYTRKMHAIINQVNPCVTQEHIFVALAAGKLAHTSSPGTTKLQHVGTAASIVLTALMCCPSTPLDNSMFSPMDQYAYRAMFFDMRDRLVELCLKVDNHQPWLTSRSHAIHEVCKLLTNMINGQELDALLSLTSIRGWQAQAALDMLNE
jgi:hypothetical protein